MNLLDWIIYALVVSAVIGLTAWSLDGVLRALGRPSRWVWLAAMTLSVGIPGAALFDSSSFSISPASTQSLEESPASNRSFFAAALAVYRTGSAVFGDAQVWLARGVVRGGDALAAIPVDEASIKRGWAAASLALLLMLAVAFGRIWVAARGWKRRTILGREVWISRTTGPASIGIFRPRVVVPEWAADLEPAELALVFSHEEEHSRVRDPMLLALAWIPVVAMPWNPFLWAQFRCLGSAVEVDCDRRVLGKGVNRRSYLALLIRLAARARADRGPMPSVARFASPLRTRMEAMIGPRRHARLAFPPVLIVGLVFVAVACGPQVPQTIRESTAPPQYDPIRVFRNTQLLDFGPFVLEGPSGELFVAMQPRVAAQDTTPLRLFPADQDTTNARACEYWRVNPDGTTRIGPGLVVNARCVPREEAGLIVGLRCRTRSREPPSVRVLGARP